MLKTKNKNTKKAQMRHCFFLKCAMMYRSDLCNLQTRKNSYKINWELKLTLFDIDTAHNIIICRPELYNQQKRKKPVKVQTA